MKRILLVLLLFAATVQLAFAQKMKVGYWTSGFSLGFGAVMEEMKFAEKEGLEVQWVKFGDVNGPTRAIVPRAIDLAFGAPSFASMNIAADGVPVRIVLATQIAESKLVVPEASPIRSLADLRGKRLGVTPPGSAMHAIVSAVLDGNYGMKSGAYSVVPGNEAQIARFLARQEIDAAVLRSVTLAQISDLQLRTLGGVVEEWKKLTRSNAAPILAVTIVHEDYLAQHPDAVAKFIAAVRKAVRFGSRNTLQVAQILQKAANMSPAAALAYASQWDGAYMASFEPADIASLKRMQEILRASGLARKDPPESAFHAEPYQRSKRIK
ncbi:MAG TPA: ABC transporter substrate-binding protein [Burkholderiales bacterium]|nr:ABC transporter substrate-binding protein [Burkholderiales bacterium]